MRKPDGIEFLYLDFDAFFANAEKHLTPELQGRPVGVIPLPSEHTSLIACCYQARQFGVKRGMSISEARELCPDIALPLARHDAYVRLHHQILAEIDRHVPVRKVWSVDEMECALTPAERARAPELGRELREGLARSISPWLTPSIGFGPNQFLAKVAAEMEKPNGLIFLHPADLPGRLLTMDLTDLPGISHRMGKRLTAAGILTVQHFWDMSPKRARHLWNSVEGERLWLQLHGYSVSRPETVRRMFGHGRVLAKGWHAPEKARECLRLLTSKAAQRLRREGYTASALDISISASGDTGWSGTEHFFPARDDHTFLGAASRLFDRGTARLTGRRLQNIYVMIHALNRPGEISSDLFEKDTSVSDRQKWEHLTDTMDAINSKHGGGLISLGLRAELPGGYAGGKIAFGRVPALEEFDAPRKKRAQRPPISSRT